MNVLYVEDYAGDAELVGIELRRRAPEISLDVAPSFFHAVERLKAYEAAYGTSLDDERAAPADGAPPRYDIVLTDLNLPDGGGLEVLAEVRNRRLPLAVVIVTGSGDENTVLGALRAGANDYLIKRGDFLANLPHTLRAALDQFRTEVGRRARLIRVLHAEPCAEDLEATVQTFARHAPHFVVEPVYTAGEVRARLQASGEARSPQVLLIEHHPPNTTAIDLLKELRQVQRLDVPVVFLTGQGGEEVARQALKFGANDYLTKDPGYLLRLPAIVENAWLRMEAVRSEQTLHEEQLRLTGIIGSAMDAIITVDEQQRILLFNDAAERMFGCPRAEVLGETIERFIPSQFREAHQHHVMKFSRGQQLVHARERLNDLIGLRANGEEFPFEASISKVVVNGRVLLTVILRDITDRQQAERALKRSEERFRSLIENASDMIIVLDVRGRIQFLSPSVKRLMGYDTETMIGQNAFDFVHTDEIQQLETALQRALVEPNDYAAVQHRFRNQDGEWRLLESVGHRLPVEGQEDMIVVNSRDITDAKKMETQFLQAQKMEAIGQLAGGVAHDFNNILTVVQSYATLLQEESVEPKEALREISLAVDRAASLSRQLLTFSRKQVVQPRDLDLNVVVADMTKMLRRTLGDDLDLAVAPQKNLPFIHADQGMMEQILLNLAVNARDAMASGGQLSIATASFMLEEAAARREPHAVPGLTVCLQVRDSGCGIPAENLPHIFEPFFSTKEAHKGTGLGLATVHGIVRQHRGWIRVESVAGKGTTFQIFFPATRAQVDRKTDSKPAETAIPGGKETILLVDDEPALRRVTSFALQHFGYHVIEASSGRQALSLYEKDRPHIDLLLTDMVMPDGVSGKELAEKLRACQPDLRVLYTSGYSVDLLSRNVTMEDGSSFLQKPYSTRKLAQMVRECLNGGNHRI